MTVKMIKKNNIFLHILLFLGVSIQAKSENNNINKEILVTNIYGYYNENVNINSICNIVSKNQNISVSHKNIHDIIFSKKKTPLYKSNIIDTPENIKQAVHDIIGYPNLTKKEHNTWLYVQEIVFPEEEKFHFVSLILSFKDDKTLTARCEKRILNFIQKKNIEDLMKPIDMYFPQYKNSNYFYLFVDGFKKKLEKVPQEYPEVFLQ